MPTLRDVVAVLDGLYDPRWADSWDAVGTVAGDPDAEVVIDPECAPHVGEPVCAVAAWAAARSLADEVQGTQVLEPADPGDPARQ